jgi:hypothetical protein
MVKADVVLVITAVTEVFLSFDWCDLHFLIQPFRLSCDTKVDSPNFDTGEEQWLQEVQPKEHFHRSIRQHRKFRYLGLILASSNSAFFSPDQSSFFTDKYNLEDLMEKSLRSLFRTGPPPRIFDRPTPLFASGVPLCGNFGLADKSE